INFAPSGVVISGPLGFGLPLTTTLAAGQQPVTVFLAVLDPSSHATAFTQPLAGGMSLTVPLTNSNPGVGTVPATVSFTAGSDNTVVQFTPVSVGQTNVSVNVPAVYTQPADNTSLTARVN